MHPHAVVAQVRQNVGVQLVEHGVDRLQSHAAVDKYDCEKRLDDIAEHLSRRV